MNFKQKLLTLSIKYQISILIILLSLLCLLFVLGLFHLYTNIIINMQKRKRKEYFYRRYKELIDSKIRFQTFLLYQYEQLIKGFNSQIYYYGLSKNDLYDTMINYKDDLIKNYEETTEEDYDPDLPDDEKLYYLYSFSDDIYMNSKVYYSLANTHSSIDNQLKGIRNFRITYLGSNTRIINEYTFVPLSQGSIYSVNRTRIKEVEELSKGNFVQYYDDLINEYVNKYKNFMNDFKKGELPFMDIFFKDKYYIFANYVNETYLRDVYRNDVNEYINNISYHFHFINYSSKKIFFTDNGDQNKVTFIEENSIIPYYLYFIFTQIQKSLDINTIPMFFENNTILSTNLCYSFLYKQIMLINSMSVKDVFDEEKINSIYNSLKKGVSNIGDCILDKKYNYDTKQNAYDVLNVKFNKYYSMKNRREFSLFKLSDTILSENFFCLKYSFPDFSSILNFKPTFFTLDQINLYSFSTFYEPVRYYGNVQTFYSNVEYLIVLCLLYLWILIFFYLVWRAKKLFVEVIEPINNLTNMINKLDVKEDNVLKYEPDDNINELFKLCNDLLLGKYKQKILHDNEINTEKVENNKSLSNFNNLKINRRLIEEMMENKNEYNLQGDEIITFKINDYLNQRKIVIKNNMNQNQYKNYDLRRSAMLKNNPNESNYNNIQEKIKKTATIEQTINALEKKMTFEVNNTNNFESLMPIVQSEENIIERQMLLNYKDLYFIEELLFHYDYKSEGKFVSRHNKLLYKNNLGNYNKFLKLRTKNKISVGKPINKEENNDESSINEKERKSASVKIRIEDFDKSVLSTYETRNLLFLWYEQAKYFKGIEFLQNNHVKELNDLCNFNFENEAKKQSNKEVQENHEKTNDTYVKKSTLRKSNKGLNKIVSKGDLIRKSRTNGGKSFSKITDIIV